TPTFTQPAASPRSVQWPRRCPRSRSNVGASSKCERPIGPTRLALVRSGALDLRPWMRVEVDVSQALGRQVRVDLGGADVGVSEHLLQRAQVTAAREQVRGERVAQRVRAHALLQARAPGVALDDLVEPLARQSSAAQV